MILLKELKLTNFLSHEKTQFSFEENEKLLIDGRSGGGKSSITEAILWTLYGRGRTENRALVRNGTKAATCSLKLVDRQHQYVITRSISSAGKSTLVVTKNTGEKEQFLPIDRVGLRDIQEWIESVLLKASYELFTNSIAYPQDNENSFVKATASRRKDLLLEIVRAGNFDTLYDKARKAISDKDIEGAVICNREGNLQNTIKEAEELVVKYNGSETALRDGTMEMLAYEAVEKKLEEQVNSISQLSKQITDKKIMKQMTINAVSVIDRDLENDRKAIAEHQTFDIEKARKGIEEAEVLSKELLTVEAELKDSSIIQGRFNAHMANKPKVNDYTKDIELLNQKLIPLIKDTGKCPAGDDCPFIVPIKGQIDFLTEQITQKTDKTLAEQVALEIWERDYKALPPVKDVTEIYKRVTELRDRISILSKNKEEVEKYEAFEKTIGEIDKRYAVLSIEKDKKLGEITTIELEITELGTTLANIDTNKINSDLSELRILKQRTQKAKDEALTGIALSAKASADIKNATKEIAILKEDVKRIKEEKESLELLKEALSPRGITAVVVDHVVPQLEERINAILGQMSDFRIRLDTQIAKADAEGVKEGLFIIIRNPEGEELPLSNLSGGETVKVSMAISEGLASLMNSVGFRILDECVTALDQESLQSFTEVVLKLQENFPQLLMVSHLNEIKDLFEKRVMIVKTNGVSKIN